MRTRLLASFLALAPIAVAADYLPLRTGNRWTYRAAKGNSTFTIAVGTPIAAGDRTWYRVTGYAAMPLYLRRDADGALYSLDLDTMKEQIVTMFSPHPGYFFSPLGPCEQEGRVEEKPAVYQDLANTWHPAAVEIRYRTFDCADAGVENEIYLDNIGLARRTVQTIAGPLDYHLASAKVGAIEWNADPNHSFRVLLEKQVLVRSNVAEEVNVPVLLRLEANRTDGVRLRYATAQRFDLVIKDAGGQVVYRWSEGQVFAQAIAEELASLREYAVTVPLRVADGEYHVEGWLATSGEAREFAAAATVRVRTETGN